MLTNKSVKMAGALLAAAALTGAGASAASNVENRAVTTRSSTSQLAALKSAVALNNSGTQSRRSYRRRLQLAGGEARLGKTAFLTKGNRAQRQRQLAGMLAKN